MTEFERNQQVIALRRMDVKLEEALRETLNVTVPNELAHKIQRVRLEVGMHIKLLQSKEVLK